jgi:hypothetical protein
VAAGDASTVVVRLRSGVAGGSPPADLQAALADLGATLVPMYPGIADAELASWFTVPRVPPPQAEALAARLRTLGAVDAAYVQPTPSTPG